MEAYPGSQGHRRWPFSQPTQRRACFPGRLDPSLFLFYQRWFCVITQATTVQHHAGVQTHSTVVSTWVKGSAPPPLQNQNQSPCLSGHGPTHTHIAQVQTFPLTQCPISAAHFKQLWFSTWPKTKVCFTRSVCLIFEQRSASREPNSYCTQATY